MGKLVKRGKRWVHEDTGAFASKTEIAAYTGSGNDKVDIEVNVNGGGRGGKASRARRGGGTGGGGPASFSGGLLGTEAVRRVKLEDGYDIAHGILDGLAELAARSPGGDVYSRAAQLRALAHPPQGQTAASRKDTAQYQAGRDIAQVLGLVAVAEGWTSDIWVQMVPRELLEAQQAGGVGSVFQSNDMADELAGSLGASILSDALEVGGAALGLAFGGPAGAAAGGLAGNLAGTFIGRQAGVGASNFMAGESPQVSDGIPGLQGGPQLDLMSAVQAAAAAP